MFAPSSGSADDRLSALRRPPRGLADIGTLTLEAWGAVVALSIFATCGVAGCADECDDVGAKWCRGTQLRECYLSGGGGHRSALNLIKTDECAERGLVCSEETGKARCVFKEPLCGSKAAVAAVCVGNVRATCETGASHPVPSVHCEGVEKHCVESKRDARCSAFPERCAESAADRCEFDRVISCVDQIWSISGIPCFGECSTAGATQCIETTDDLEQPLEFVASCVGQPGIWRRVGPACQSGCACEGEKTACRCQEWSPDFIPL